MVPRFEGRLGRHLADRLEIGNGLGPDLVEPRRDRLLRHAAANRLVDREGVEPGEKPRQLRGQEVEGNVCGFPLDSRYAGKPGVAGEGAAKRGRRQAVEAEDGNRQGSRRGEDRQDPRFDSELAFHLGPLGKAEDPGIVDEEGDAVAALAQGKHGEGAEVRKLCLDDAGHTPNIQGVAGTHLRSRATSWDRERWPCRGSRNAAWAPPASRCRRREQWSAPARPPASRRRVPPTDERTRCRNRNRG